MTLHIPGLEVDVWRGEDGATVVQIDTPLGLGRLRVNVNDWAVADGNPEQIDLRGIHPGDIVSNTEKPYLDWREVHSVGLDWLSLLGPSGNPMGPFPSVNYKVERQREGQL